MTIEEQVKEKLEKFPEFRERSTRGKYLSILALRATNLEAKQKEEKLTLEELADFGVKFDSYRHAWGDVTREYKELRGKDYGDGEILKQEWLLEHGFEPQRKLNI